MSDTALPVTVEEVTAKWLTSALAFRFPGAVVTSCMHVDVLPGTSTKVRVALEYNDVGRSMALPSRMIVKGGFQEHSPSMKDMYRNEMRFYRDVTLDNSYQSSNPNYSVAWGLYRQIYSTDDGTRPPSASEYALETSTNLAATNGWSALSTNQILSNSLLQVTGASATNSRLRYYRTRLTP